MTITYASIARLSVSLHQIVKQLDHIIPIAFDHKLIASSGNLATIYNKCHRLKTKWEQEYYGTGQGMEIITTRQTGGLHIGYKPIIKAGVSRRWLSLCSSQNDLTTLPPL